ncbi:MAG: hypothetical protein J2P37_01790 [Ktedonobacteraceae bacterium]|nr:hypothetical protein [Ktedonobacteraceae bacterium]
MTETPERYDETAQQLTAHFVADWQSGEQPHLSAYLPRPATGQAGAAADFVAYYLSVEEHLPPPGMTRPAPLSRRSQAALERLKTIPAHPSTLLRTRRGRQITPRQLAQKLDLSADLILQLEQRQLDPQTLPDALYHRLARALSLPPPAVRAYLELEQPGGKQLARRPRKVAERPHTYAGPMRSFRAALQECTQLTARQQTTWLTILDQEHL